MSQSVRVKRLVLQCEVRGCTFTAPGRPEILPSITAEEIETLINSYLKDDFQPTPEQKDRLKQIFGHQLTCPVHGRKHLGYQAEIKASGSFSFEIDLDEAEAVEIRFEGIPDDANPPDGWTDGDFLIEF